MLRAQGEILQVDRQELLNATTAKEFQQVMLRPHNTAFQTEDLDTYDLTLMISRMYKRFLWLTFPSMVLTLSQRLTNDFGKRFTPQQVLLAEQAFWLCISNPTIESSLPPIRVEVPSKLPKNNLKAQLKDKDTTICKFKDTIKSLRKNNKEEIVDHDACDIETINEELENSVAKLLSENECLCKEINHVKQEQADILRGIVKQAKAIQPLDSTLDFTCKHAKRIQELLVYVRDTCPNAVKLSETKVARTPMKKIKKVTFSEPIASPSTNQETHNSNKPMLHSTRVKCSTSASGSKPSGNTKNNMISQPSSSNKINKVEDQPRSIKTRKNKKNHVMKVKCDDHVMQSMSNANPVSVSINNAYVKNSVNDVQSGCLCAICGKCMIIETHHACVHLVVTKMNESQKSKSAKKHKNQMFGNLRVVQIVLWYLDSECSKHMTGNRSQLINIVSKFLGTVRFGNGQIARIIGYGDYQLENVIILRVYYVEGLRHNLFSVGQFCDADLEVGFWKNTYFIRNLKGVDLLFGSCDTNLYTISLDDMLKSSLICLLSKASKIKNWLWNRRLSHINFACALGKSKKSSHQPKAEDTNQEKLSLLHMDLCGLMRVASINEKRTSKLLKQTKLMQIQEDHLNPIRALNVDSLKDDSVVTQNPCSETEDNKSETASSKSVKESSLDSATKDVHAIKYKMSKAKERCMTYFRSLHSHL
uniref:Copia protein n=1 Tax=Tanacetum cinerariifolium TaxID=118510 RepID=A0A6L2K8U7_TANCI|nr:copia protein [Tanacetum cinerariifolium]